jgi:hypothetical protein
MSYECNIKVRAARQLRNNWNEVIADAGEELTIIAIHCHDGPYTYKRGSDLRTHTVPRSWLVECGALEPLGPVEKAEV